MLFSEGCSPCVYFLHLVFLHKSPSSSMPRAGGWSMRNTSQLVPAGLSITDATWRALTQSSGPGQGSAYCCEYINLDLAAEF